MVCHALILLLGLYDRWYMLPLPLPLLHAAMLTSYNSGMNDGSLDNSVPAGSRGSSQNG